MQACLKCSKIFSGKCRHCPTHLAELAEHKRKIDEHINQIVIQVWRLQGGSNQPETMNKAVSDDFSPSPKYETKEQAGRLLSIDNSYCDPACTLAPLAQPGQSVRTEQANQDDHDNLLKMSMPCSDVAGSNPARGIPAERKSDVVERWNATQLFGTANMRKKQKPHQCESLPDNGAGEFFYSHKHHLLSCADYNYRE